MLGGERGRLLSVNFFERPFCISFPHFLFLASLCSIFCHSCLFKSTFLCSFSLPPRDFFHLVVFLSSICKKKKQSHPICSSFKTVSDMFRGLTGPIGCGKVRKASLGIKPSKRAAHLCTDRPDVMMYEGDW